MLVKVLTGLEMGLLLMNLNVDSLGSTAYLEKVGQVKFNIVMFNESNRFICT